MFRNFLKVQSVGPIRMNATKARPASSGSTFPVINAKITTAITRVIFSISFTVSVEGFSGESALFLLLVFFDTMTSFYEKNMADRTGFL